MDNIEEQLKEIIVARCGLNAKAEDIGNDDSLVEKWGMESVKILEVVVGLEDQFDIEFEDDEFTQENFATISRIAKVVRGKI